MDLYEKYIHQLCKQYIKKDNKVFDCGCGGGYHTSIVKQYAQNIIGGDLNCRLDKKYKIQFRKIDINQYGDEEEFNVVTSWDVIEHVEDDTGYLKEIIKIVKPGGLIIIGTPNRNRISNKILSFFKGEIKYPYCLGNSYEMGGDVLHLREYTRRDFINLAKKFNNVEIVDLKEGFFGIYTPLGPIGCKWLNQKLFKRWAQHLYIILRKKDV